MVTGIYANRTDVSAMQTELATALETKRSIMAQQSVTVPGRTIQRADLRAVIMEIAELTYAIRLQGGTIVRETVADMSGG